MNDLPTIVAQNAVKCANPKCENTFDPVTHKRGRPRKFCRECRKPRLTAKPAATPAPALSNADPATITMPFVANLTPATIGVATCSSCHKPMAWPLDKPSPKYGETFNCSGCGAQNTIAPEAK